MLPFEFHYEFSSGKDRINTIFGRIQKFGEIWDDANGVQMTLHLEMKHIVGKKNLFPSRMSALSILDNSNSNLE